MFDASFIDPTAPMSVGAMVAMITSSVAIVGVLLTWVSFYYRRVEFKAAEKQREEIEEERFETLIKRVCREFTSSEEYMVRLDKQMIIIATAVMDEAFRERSSSFVDAKYDQARHQEIDRRIIAIDSAVNEIRKSVAVQAEQIAADVARRVALILRGEKQG